MNDCGVVLDYRPPTPLTADNLARAKDLCRWKWFVRNEFGKIRIESVTDSMGSSGDGAQIGKPIRVEANLDLGQLRPDDDPRKARNYVREAIGKVMAGEKVEVAESKPYGCTVKYAE